MREEEEEERGGISFEFIGAFIFRRVFAIFGS